MIADRINKKGDNQSRTPEKYFQAIGAGEKFQESFHRALQFHFLNTEDNICRFWEQGRIAICLYKIPPTNYSIHNMYRLFIDIQSRLHQSLRQRRMNRHNMPQILSGAVKFHQDGTGIDNIA